LKTTIHFDLPPGQADPSALHDLARLHNEVADRGVNAVLEDLRAAERLAPRGGTAARKLAALLRALDLEAHQLRAWDPQRHPELFLQQLRNRCFASGEAELQGEAEQLLAQRRWPYLRERFGASQGASALLRTLQGHQASVNAVALTPDGRLALSTSKDQLLILWDLETGQQLRTLSGHTDQVNGVAIFGDGRRAISASIDRTLKIWDLETGQLQTSLTGHEMGVWAVAVTPDGAWAVSGSLDGTGAVWSLGSGKRLCSLTGHGGPVMGVAVSSDGRRAITASDDGTLLVWDLRNGRDARLLSSHRSGGGIRAVALSADGSLALSASTDRSLVLWDVAQVGQLGVFRGHTADVVDVRWLTSDLAISASLDGSLMIWDVERGESLCTLVGHSAGVTSVAVSADGRRAVSTSRDKTLKVWSLERALEGRGRKPGLARSQSGPAETRAALRYLAVSNNGRWAAAAGTDGSIQLWSLESGSRVRSIAGHAGRDSELAEVREIRISDDGRWPVTVSNNGWVTVWDIESGEVAVHCHCGATCSSIALSGDGLTAIVVGGYGDLELWDLTTGKLARTLPTALGSVFNLRVSADGRRPMTLVWDRPSQVWDMTTGRSVASIQTGRSLRAMSGDGLWAIACVRSYDATDYVEVLDLVRGGLVHRVRATGQMAICDGGGRIACAEGSLVLLDPAAPKAALTLKTDAKLVCCAFVPGGRTVVAGDATGALHVVEEASFD
jgi:WD40 repeat protein